MNRRDAQIAVAVFAGTTLRLCRRALRKAVSVVPGLAGAAGTAIGLGQVAGHVWGRGLTWWVALTVGGVFALLIGREVNQSPPAPRRSDD